MSEEPKGGSVGVNGIELYYEVAGEGEPLLLLHGMTGCSGDWVYAGREQLAGQYRLIAPEARGHGRSTNPGKTITHRQCALDMLALLDHLGIARCKVMGVSMGGNTLLHMATMRPERIEAMVVVSATMRFPEQARKIMAQVPVENQPAEQWELMRKRHKLGDEQIVALWEQCRALKDSYDDMNFTAADLSRITASTLIVYGDRDPLFRWRWRWRCTCDSGGEVVGGAWRRAWPGVFGCGGAVCADGGGVFQVRGEAGGL